MSDYMAQASAYASMKPYTPLLSDSLASYAAVTLVGLGFLLSFVFSTLPKKTVPLPELGVALIASALLGLGTVATFCWMGVSV